MPACEATKTSPRNQLLVRWCLAASIGFPQTPGLRRRIFQWFYAGRDLTGVYGKNGRNHALPVTHFMAPRASGLEAQGIGVVPGKSGLLAGDAYRLRGLSNR